MKKIAIVLLASFLIEVKPTISGIKKGKDELLEKAIEIILKK